MSINADHPGFTTVVDIRMAQEDCDKAADHLEQMQLINAAICIKQAQEELAKAAFNITLMISRSNG